MARRRKWVREEEGVSDRPLVRRVVQGRQRVLLALSSRGPES